MLSLDQTFKPSKILDTMALHQTRRRTRSHFCRAFFAILFILLILPSFLEPEAYLNLLHQEEKDNPPQNKMNKFYAWDNPNGINIDSLLSYYEWLAFEGIRKEKWSYECWPIVPIWLRRDNQSGRVVVKISMAAYNKIPNARGGLWGDRVTPMLNFMVETLNRPVRTRRHSPRRDVTRLFQLLEQGYDIPFLMDFGDVAICGNNVFNSSSIVHPQHKLFNLQVPIFAMCRQRDCQYSFPVPTYLGLRHSKNSPGEWDRYFLNSSSLYPWENKINSAGWRGSGTGPWRKPGRAWLVEQTPLAPSIIDAHFASKEKRISFEDFQTYKVIIDIDGNGWSGRFLRLLCMNSIVVKIRPRFFDYNSEQLKEWTHYIPYNPEASPSNIYNSSFPDFIKHTLVDESDQKLRNIVSNANSWCREHMSYPSIQDDLLDIFALYVGELDKNDASWETKWRPSFDLVLDAKTFR